MIEQQKNTLLSVVDDMAKAPSLFAKNPEKDFTRNRKLDFATLLRFILCMGGQGIDTELNRYFSIKACMTKSAYIQQRNKLLPEALDFLFKEYNSRCEDSRLYKGYRLLAADGTALDIARDETADSFFDNKEGYNQLHLNVLYDLMNQVYFDALITPRPKLDERNSMLAMLNRTVRDEKALVIADRGYDSYMVIETLNRMPNVDYLIRVRNDRMTNIRQLPMMELDTDIETEIRTTQTNEDRALRKAGKIVFLKGESKSGKPKKRVDWTLESPCIVKYRVVRFIISEDDNGPVYETVVTSLPRNKFPLDKIKDLYNMRWGVETAFRDLKYTLGLSHLHAKKEEAVTIEIFARLTAYNYCKRVVIAIGVKQNKKYDYAINFVFAKGICMSYLRGDLDSDPPPDIEDSIGNHIVPIRPGRTDKRKVSPKSFVPFLYRVA